MARKGLKLSDFATDEAKENEGTWIKPNPGLPTEFKIASFYNPSMGEYFRNQGVFATGAFFGDMNGKEYEDMLINGLAEYVLLDWKGVCNDDGSELKYSKDEAKKALRMRNFRRVIMEMSMDFENFKLLKQGEAAKN